MLERKSLLTIRAVFVAALFTAPIARDQAQAQAPDIASSSREESDRSLQQLIDSLASPTAAERQHSFQVLVEGGERSIPMLKQAAITADIDVAEACVGAIFRIGVLTRNEIRDLGDSKSEKEQKVLQRVIETLTEIAEDENAKGSQTAKQVVRELSMSDLDRALEALSASGARYYPSKNKQVYSIQLDSDRQLKWLHYLDGLRHISLRGPNVTDACLPQLKGLDSVQSINFSDTAITDDGVKFLQRLPKLKSVSLSGDGLTEIAIFYLSKLPNLTSLSWGGVTDEISLDALSQIQNLRSLSLTRVTWFDEITSKLNAMKEIRSVRLYCSNVTDENCLAMAEISKEVYLSLRQSDQITKVGWKAIGRVPLTGLSLMQTSIDDDSLVLLGDQPKLTTLSISGSEITDQGLKNLDSLKSLRSALFHGTKITVEGVNHLVKSIPTLRRVSGDVNLQIHRP